MKKLSILFTFTSLLLFASCDKKEHKNEHKAEHEKMHKEQNEKIDELKVKLEATEAQLLNVRAELSKYKMKDTLEIENTDSAK